MSLLKNTSHFGRFKGLPWFDAISNSTIFVGGAGGISSWLTLFLARAGAQIYVVDSDTVDEVNLAGQVYGKEDVGKPKVQAISSVISRLCGENKVRPIQEFVDSDGEGVWARFIPKSDVVCVGFDNLKARDIIYKEWRAKGKEKSFFIDGRLSAENGQIFTLSKNSSEEDFLAYEQTYFPESERVELPCTMKATSHCGALIASLMTAQITNWFNNQSEENIEREISNVEFHLQLMIFEQPKYKVKKQEDELIHSPG